jgi:hypothetical protein
VPRGSITGWPGLVAFLLASGCGDGPGATPVACANTACPDPHPAGWVQPTSAAFHGTEARRSTGCVACHDQGPSVLCLACHRAGGPAAVNVHLPDFLASHTLADVAGNALAPIGGGISVACLGCHAP